MLSALHEQPVLPVADPKAFGAVKVRHRNRLLLQPGQQSFLKSLERAELAHPRLRAVLRKGMLGASTAAEYDRLGNGDQGQIREFYLASLEKVARRTAGKVFQAVRVLLSEFMYSNRRHTPATKERMNSQWARKSLTGQSRT